MVILDNDLIHTYGFKPNFCIIERIRMFIKYDLYPPRCQFKPPRPPSMLSIHCKILETKETELSKFEVMKNKRLTGYENNGKI